MQGCVAGNQPVVLDQRTGATKIDCAETCFYTNDLTAIDHRIEIGLMNGPVARDQTARFVHDFAKLTDVDARRMRCCAGNSAAVDEAIREPRNRKRIASGTGDGAAVVEHTDGAEGSQIRANKRIRGIETGKIA